MPSGCVWCTCGAGTNACSSVSIEERGAAGSSWQRARWATMSSSLISSRSNSGSISSRRSGVKSPSPIVARSEPEPLTHIVATSRPTWSVLSPFAEVLPPPKLATARSEPSRWEASRTWPSASSGTPDDGQRSSARSTMWSAATLIAPTPRPPRRWFLAPRPSAPRSRRAQLGDRVLGGAEPGADLRAQRPDVGAVGVQQHLVAAEHVAGLLRGGQRVAVDEQRLGVGLLQVDDAEHHRLDLGLDVVRLVDRQPRQRPRGELDEDQEQLERVDRADDRGRRRRTCGC